MRSRLHLTWLVILLLAGGACDRAAPRDDDEAAVEGPAGADFGPSAAYDRHLVFLGPGDALPTAAVFDFAALGDSSRVSRGVRARIVDGQHWVPLLDTGWQMEPMREPWRLVPHGPLRLIMNDAGEVGALVYRGNDLTVRLEPGPTIAELSPDAGTQLRLRQARLDIDGENVPGVLLDAQLGRSVPRGYARRGAVRAVDSGAEDEATAAEDTIAPADPTPTARPGTEAVLVDNSGFYAVFAESGAGDLAWLHGAGRDETRDGVHLEPTAFEPFDPAGVDVPTRWRITAPGEGIAGELQLQAADRTALAGPDLSALGYVLVSGWIEDRGVRREVFGLVRHVR